jgi:DNA-binding transcriptional LysR family regulator
MPDTAEDVQLPYLETFSKAAELSSFTGAARALGLTQAAVSQRIHALEKRLDIALFNRQAGRILLTRAGQQLYSYAQRILELHHKAQEEITGQKPPITGDLFLAASSIPGEHLLPALLSVFHQQFPGIKVRASVTDSMAVMNQVERGEANLGLVGRKKDSPNLEFRVIAEDHMLLVVPRSHPWRGRRRVSLKQLCSQPMILREEGSGMRFCFEKALGRQGKSLRDLQVELELGSNEAVKEAVLQGIGIAVLSCFAVQKELKTGALHGLKVSDLECDREILAVWDRRRVLSGPARTFLVFLESHPPPLLPHKRG